MAAKSITAIPVISTATDEVSGLVTIPGLNIFAIASVEHALY